MTTDTTVVGPTGRPSSSTVLTAVNGFFDARLAGATPQELSERFHEDVDWFIQGDTGTVAWIGRKAGRAGVAEHFAQLAESIQPEGFAVDVTMADGNRALVVGTFSSRVVATGRLIDSEYVFDISVDDTGLVTRYHMLEDSWAVSQAARP